MLRWLLLLSMLALNACASPGAPEEADTDTLVPVDPAAYTGLWTPDLAVNRKLANAMQKQMRQRMAKLHPGGKPGGMGGGPGGMGGGPGGGGGPPGGMSGGPGGMPPGGAPADMPEPDPLAMMSMVGMMRPEMDFASPLQADLRITMDPNAGVEIGAANASPVMLMFHGGSRELGEGGLRGFASIESGRLVIEINTDDGTRVTHTYLIESQGKRLRIKSMVMTSKMPIPGGLPIERVFNRVESTSAVVP